jgi:hypothetical protein
VKVRQTFIPVWCLERSEGMTVRVKVRQTFIPVWCLERSEGMSVRVQIRRKAEVFYLAVGIMH